MNTTPENDYLDTKIGKFHKDPSVSTIYIGNLDYGRDELGIQDLFEEFGRVNYVKIVKDENTTLSKGFAFVQMVDRKKAMYAISQLNGAYVDDRSLKVSLANENDEERPVKKKRRKPYKAYISKADRAAMETANQ